MLIDFSTSEVVHTHAIQDIGTVLKPNSSASMYRFQYSCYSSTTRDLVSVRDGNFMSMEISGFTVFGFRNKLLSHLKEVTD